MMQHNKAVHQQKYFTCRCQGCSHKYASQKACDELVCDVHLVLQLQLQQMCKSFLSKSTSHYVSGIQHFGCNMCEKAALRSAVTSVETISIAVLTERQCFTRNKEFSVKSAQSSISRNQACTNTSKIIIKNKVTNFHQFDSLICVS